jgi:ATP-dependent DNA helicase DinG
VDEFKKSQGGILLGMESFGEGIDIPGDDLEFILIDKIPDIRQEIVIQERRNFYDKTFGNEFTDYFLAGRTRSLHQKIGRLIRTANDRGGAIVVDNRIKNWKSNTLKQFKQLMLPYEVQFADMENAVLEIEKFLLRD